MGRIQKLTIEQHRDRAARVLAALRGGKTIRDILGGSKTRPLQPIAHHWWMRQYREIDPVFATEVDRLAPINAKAKDKLKGLRNRLKTHCKRGHLLAGDNVYQTTGKRSGRECQECRRLHWRPNAKYTADGVRLVLAGLDEGETITSLTKGGSSAYVMPHQALFNFRRDNPRLGRLIQRKSAENAKVRHAAADMRRRKIVAGGHISVAHQSDGLFRLICELSSAFPPEIREEVRSRMALAMAEGLLRSRDQIVAAVGEYKRQHFRAFSKYGPVSLDMPSFKDGDMPLIETISQGMWQPEPWEDINTPEAL